MNLVLHTTAATSDGQIIYSRQEGRRGGTHIGELADGVGLHSNVVLLQLLLDLIDALGDVLGLNGRQQCDSGTISAVGLLLPPAVSRKQGDLAPFSSLSLRHGDLNQARCMPGQCTVLGCLSKATGHLFSSDRKCLQQKSLEVGRGPVELVGSWSLL